MPTYSYACTECDNRFDAVQAFTDDALTTCPQCSAEVDAQRGGIAKYNPLAHWTERDLWSRIHERGLPYHPLHDEGYASIGCAPCTLPGTAREGRWAGTAKTECGLHT